jgi:L-threonylcarbamoyladenylate synthase
MPDPIGDAVAWVRDGGLLAYPTETVWGLGAAADADRALERLRRWKGRGESVPLAILVEEVGDLGPLGFEVEGAVERLAAAFWPGPLTLVLKSRHRFGRGVARADGAVGVRCSAHPLAAAIARRLRDEGVGPITATSLNPSGQSPARTRDEAGAVCGEGDEVPHLIDVDQAESGGDEASTVVDLTGDSPRVLRWGAVPAAELEPLLRELGAP